MKVLAVGLVLMTMMLAACAPPAKPLCETPYVFIESTCCMDVNNDGICDEPIPTESDNQEIATPETSQAHETIAPDVTETVESKPTTEPSQTDTQTSQTPAEPSRVDAPTPSKDYVQGAASVDRTAVQPKQEKSLTLKDSMYEYRTRRYYYTDETFGVTEPFYKGSAPPISAPDAVEIEVLGIESQPGNVDLRFNEYKSGIEHAGYLKVGDSYVTKSGIKLTVDSIKVNMMEFTLERVSPNEHTEYCVECLRQPTALSLYDDGVKVAEIGTTDSFSVLGKAYTVDLLSVDEKQRPRLQIKPGDNPIEVVPLLNPGQEYVLSNGVAVKYLFGHLNSVIAEKPTGYAVFGFVKTTELPLRAKCPECMDFIALDDGETRDVVLGGKKRSMHLNVVNGETLLTIDNKQAKITEKLTQVDTDTFASIMQSEPYLIGITFKGGTPPLLYCRESLDAGTDPETVGKIRYAIGSTEYLVERTDTCRDSHTLAEYSCTPIIGREKDAKSGKGFAPQVTYVDCECFSDGVCA